MKLTGNATWQLGLPRAQSDSPSRNLIAPVFMSKTKTYTVLSMRARPLDVTFHCPELNRHQTSHGLRSSACSVLSIWEPFSRLDQFAGTDRCERRERGHKFEVHDFYKDACCHSLTVCLAALGRGIGIRSTAKHWLFPSDTFEKLCSLPKEVNVFKRMFTGVAPQPKRALKYRGRGSRAPPGKVHRAALGGEAPRLAGAPGARCADRPGPGRGAAAGPRPSRFF